MRSGIEGKLLPDAIRYVVESSGLMEYYGAADEKEKKGFSEARTDNLEELVNSVGDFSFDDAASDAGGTEELQETPRGVRAVEFYLGQILLNFGERTAIIGSASMESDSACTEKFSAVSRWKLKSAVSSSRSCFLSCSV